MRLAVVGTRFPTTRQIARVFHIVASSPPDTVIVSGGAKGIDSAARHAANLYRRELVEHRPEKHTHRMPYTAALFERNTDIANDGDACHALPDARYFVEGKGGTKNTIGKVKARKKPLRIWPYPDASWDGTPPETWRLVDGVYSRDVD